ncbi:MAG: hypothetical protein HIU89_10450 [Proteobacteria bacterium]|nr:hypothetical protein [Pseudomonadota bacterium]
MAALQKKPIYGPAKRIEAADYRKAAKAAPDDSVDPVLKGIADMLDRLQIIVAAGGKTEYYVEYSRAK